MNDRLRRLYLDEQKSIPQIAAAVGLPRSTVRSRLIAAGVPLRSRADGVRLRSDVLGKHLIGKTRSLSPEWRLKIALGRRKWAEGNAAGVRITSNGYIEHTMGPEKGRPAHDVMMEKRIGRRLTNGEVVHLLDGDRLNLDPENHELTTRSKLARDLRLAEINSGLERRRDRLGRFA